MSVTPGLLQPEQLVPEQMPRLRVEPGRRLVQQQQVGLAHQRPRDRQPPLHPARQLVDLHLRLVRQRDELEQLVRPLPAVGPAEPEVPAVDGQVLVHGQLGSSVSSCGHTPSRARIAGPSVAGSIPRIRSSPPLTGETAPIIRIVDDLPAPLGPRNPNASPFQTSRSIPAPPRSRRTTSAAHAPEPEPPAAPHPLDPRPPHRQASCRFAHASSSQRCRCRPLRLASETTAARCKLVAGQGYPRPTYGMPAAITVRVGTATTVGSCAIRTTKSATIFGSKVGSTAIVPVRLQHALLHPLGHRGRRVADVDLASRDAVRAAFQLEALVRPGDRVLRRRVRDRLRPRYVRRDRPVVDDPPTRRLLPQHQRERRLRAQERPGQVRVDNRRQSSSAHPVLRRPATRSPRCSPAGRSAPALAKNAAPHAPSATSSTAVRTSPTPPAPPLDLLSGGRGLPQLRLGPPGHRDLEPGRRERERHLPPQPGPATGDHRDLLHPQPLIATPVTSRTTRRR